MFGCFASAFSKSISMRSMIKARFEGPRPDKWGEINNLDLGVPPRDRGANGFPPCDEGAGK